MLNTHRKPSKTNSNWSSSATNTMIAPYSLILGSSSVYRQSQLRQLTEKFNVISPHVDESAMLGENAKDLALRLSEKKALAIYSLLRNDATLAESNKGSDVIICGDQTASLGSGLESEILGKPKSIGAAIEQLTNCSGKTALFHSAITVLATHTKAASNEGADAESYTLRSEIVDTQVTFRDLKISEITRYIERDKPLLCAGSFKCESLGIALFDSISSDDPSALIGLPLISVARILREFGINVIDL